MTDEKAGQQTDIILGNQEIPQQIETTPQTFISQAIQQGLSIEHLEKLMNLQERWEANQAKKLFFESLAKFQSLCPTLAKTKKVSFPTTRGKTEYNYAPLGEIATSIKEPMSQCGLSHRWEIEDKTDLINCTCIITHSAGHSEKSSMSAKKDESGGKNEIQSRGSTITYLQRYTIISALGIATADEDNDAVTASDIKPIPKQEPQAKKPEPKQEEKAGTIKEQFESCLNMVQLSNVWNKLSAKEKKEFEVVKNEQKEKIRLLSLSIPLTETSSIFEIEEKLNFIKTKSELDTFTRCNQKVLDELNDDNINKKFQSILKSLA